jgi:hypothetical protein
LLVKARETGQETLEKVEQVVGKTGQTLRDESEKQDLI